MQTKTKLKLDWATIRGKKIHGRSARSKYGKESSFPRPWQHCASETKHLYVKILDSSYKLMNQVILDYPKRVKSRDNAASGFQSEEDGATPISTLQLSRENVI